MVYTYHNSLIYLSIYGEFEGSDDQVVSRNNLMQTGTIFPQPLALASHLAPRGMRALVALLPEEPCRTELWHTLCLLLISPAHFGINLEKKLKWRGSCRHELKEPTFQNPSFNLSIRYSRALITLFCSIFHYSIDKMLYKFNSCLYQLAWGKIGFITCHFTQSRRTD